MHVAHVVQALNSMRRSAAREPDVDVHVEVLQVLADDYVLKPPDAVATQGAIIPAAMLRPVLSHGLFVVGTQGVDVGVQHGIERLLNTMADRLALAVVAHEESGAGAPPSDGAELLHKELTLVIPALRKMLRAAQEDVYRTSLRVFAHAVRALAPHAAALQAWQQPARPAGAAAAETEEGAEGVEGAECAVPMETEDGAAPATGDAAAVFGASAAALLHADLLPLMKLKAAKGDEGGDLFANLLNLQKHRRGRGLHALARAAEEGKLSKSTLTHFVIPLCLQALLQRASSSQAFDPNYAEVAVTTLGSCMKCVAWGVCLTTVRFLAALLAKSPSREKWVIRAACECLLRFPCPERPVPGPEVYYYYYY